MDENWQNRFSGIARLYGEESLEVFRRSHALVVGLGGVGSWTVEALARSGVGAITLVDFDDICVSNTNRQSHTLENTVGKLKTQVLKTRLQAINPKIRIAVIEEAYSPEMNSVLFSESKDVVVDAIDRSHTKLFLAQACLERKVPEVVVGSAGGRLAPQLIKTGDLSQSLEDNLLSILRKDLRRQSGLPRKGKMGIDVVYSLEKPRYPLGPDEFSVHKPADRTKRPLDCSTGFGTSTAMTGTFGFLAADLALKALLKKHSIFL